MVLVIKGIFIRPYINGLVNQGLGRIRRVHGRVVFIGKQVALDDLCRISRIVLGFRVDQIHCVDRVDYE